ncbi:FHA domain containing protein [Frankia sp. Hr75.2]|uniref:FHA domain-containing protein n=1 Tax=Parafrankia sp. Ea1.12 TaxID=573499 RepID=UPI000DA49A53|nr:FHA domain-containing protein [Parafrankia sp. Ea1.12]CAI7980791.1 FHA domain containing protein [Frankia sp. Hr75.2]SQD96224.1 FHA domain containing protein [Parafrankia sp. Ea1.12]
MSTETGPADGDGDSPHSEGEDGPAYRPPTGWLAGPGPGRAYPTPELSGATTQHAAGRGGTTGRRTDPDTDDDPDEPDDVPDDPDDYADGEPADDLPAGDAGIAGAGPGGPPAAAGGLALAGSGEPPAPRAGRGRPPLGSWDPDDSFAPRFPRAEATPAHCPHCRARPAPTDRFCLRCRYEFATGRRPVVPRVYPAPAASPRWDAVVEVDEAHFARVIGDGVRLPEGRLPWVVHLDGPEILIGAGPDGPPVGVDLSGPADDPAVSGRHASLVRQPDGGYAVVDHGSLNGTRVNDSSQPIPAGHLVSLRDGDRVFVGAWTRITIRRP